MFDICKDKHRSIHTLTGELLLEAMKRLKPQATVAMDKSLDCIHYADELVKIFGDRIRFLFVIRDPRAQINSMNKAIIHEFSTLANALIWKDNYTKALNLMEAYPDKTLKFSFEEFIYKEKETIQKVCDFLEIPFEEKMIDITQSAEAKELHTMSKLWESNFSAPIVSNIDKFKKELSAEDINVIESICGELMDKLGYQRINESSQNITEEQIKKSLEESATKRKEEWAILEYDDKEDYERRIKRAKYIE